MAGVFVMSCHSSMSILNTHSFYLDFNIDLRSISVHLKVVQILYQDSLYGQESWHIGFVKLYIISRLSRLFVRTLSVEIPFSFGYSLTNIFVIS